MGLIKSAIGKALFAAAGYSLADELRKKDDQIQKLETALSGSQAEAGAAWGALSRRIRSEMLRGRLKLVHLKQDEIDITLTNVSGRMLDEGITHGDILSGIHVQLHEQIDADVDTSGPKYLVWTGTAERVPQELRPSVGDRGLLELYVVNP